MISTISMKPSGMVKWGWPYRVSASDSFDSPCMIEYPPKSFRVAEAPAGVTLSALPSGAPMSTRNFEAFDPQSIQASIPVT